METEARFVLLLFCFLVAASAQIGRYDPRRPVSHFLCFTSPWTTAEIYRSSFQLPNNTPAVKLICLRPESIKSITVLQAEPFDSS